MRYARVFSVLLILMTFTQLEAVSQNYIFYGSNSGLHAAAQLATSQFDDIGAVQAGYTFNGRLTFGVDLGKSNDRLNRVNSNIIRPYVSYLITKQSEGDLPISISTDLGYQYNVLPTTSFSSSSLQIGVGAYHELDVGQSFDLIPFLRWGMRRDQRESTTMTVDGVDLFYNGGITFRWARLYISPTITRASLNYLSYGVVVGYRFDSQG